MDKRKKTRQGDSTLIDIRTFVRHMSALILGVRDEYHQVHILTGGGGCSNLMEDVFDAETCSLRVIFFFFSFFMLPDSFNHIKRSCLHLKYNVFRAGKSFSDVIIMTRVNRFEKAKYLIK